MTPKYKVAYGVNSKVIHNQYVDSMTIYLFSISIETIN